MRSTFIEHTSCVHQTASKNPGHDLKIFNWRRTRALQMNGFVTVLLLAAVAVTSPFDPYSVNQAPSEFPIDHDHVSPEFPSPSVDIQTPIDTLTKRGPPNPGPIDITTGYGWVIKYRPYYSFIIPIQVAASVLEEFYNQCLRRIAREPSSNIMNAFTFSIGSVFLAIRVADPTQGMDWWGIRIIVETLLDNVRAGFTVQFNAEFRHPETNALLYISLSMLQRIAPGPVEGD